MANSRGNLWVKICGLTDPAETLSVAQAGADAIGFICVPRSPRYVSPAQLPALTQPLQSSPWGVVERVGVFVDATPETLAAYQVGDRLTALQLHGQESPTDCQRLRARYPDLKLIKAFRIRRAADLLAIAAYDDAVDRVLLDAYHPQQLGGTGQTLDWSTLQRFQPRHPWILAGGLTPENVTTALADLAPYGIDLSSGVEINPGHKDLGRVQHLFQGLRFQGLRSRQPIPQTAPTAD